MMKAYQISRLGPMDENADPLTVVELPVPAPKPQELLIRVSVCGVCHTELDEIEGRTPPPRLPVTPGHQVVGRVMDVGPAAHRFKINQRVGVAWINRACGHCEACGSGQENLCPDFKGTGRDVDGGYAQFMIVHEAFAYAIPNTFTDVAAAPLLCAGAIGYRSLLLSGLHNGQELGLMGFGASAHLVLQLTRHRFPRSRVSVFARSGRQRHFARLQGAHWAGPIDRRPPQALHAIIDTTPAWKTVLTALDALRPGGRLVINAIRKEQQDLHHLLRLSYERHMWMEKEIKSVANVQRRDVARFLTLAAEIQIRPEVQTYPFEAANQALRDLRFSRSRGAKVLVTDS